VLLGRNEIAPDGTKRAGDPDARGSASATIDEASGQLCFGLTAKNLGQPVAAHIHRGSRGKNGPIVLPLVQPSAGDPGASSGCVDITQDLAREIAEYPRRYYWNIHTQDYPAGAIRGQLFRRSR
jgi:hypothetical protein